MSLPPIPGALRGLIAALVGVLAAFAITHLTWPLFQPTPMALFYPAVVAGVWVGGVGAGAAAILFSAILCNIAFQPPYGTFSLALDQITIVSTFLLVASAIVGLVASRQRAAAGERAHRRWFAETLSSLGDAVIASDAQGRVTLMNDVAERLTGWTTAEAAGRRLDEVFTIAQEGTREPSSGHLDRASGAGLAVGHADQRLLMARGGEEIAIEVSAGVISDETGRRRGGILVFRDETEKRKAERAADEAHRQTTNVLESITDAYVAFDKDWRITYVNEMTEQITGLSRERLIGMDHWELFPAAVGSPIEEAYRRALERRETVEFESLYEPWGRWFAGKASPARDGGVIAYFREITDRVRAEEEQARLGDRVRLALDSAQLGSWNMDPATHALETDERFRIIFAGSPAPMKVEEAFGHIHPDDQARVWTAVAAATRTEDPQPYSAEYRVVHADGSIRWVLAKGRANFKGEGSARRLASFDGTVADHTDRKLAEQRLLASEERYRTLFTSIDESFCVIEMMYDPDGKPVDYRFVEVNPAFEKHTGLKDAVGKTVYQLIPNIEPHWLATYSRVAETGEPIRFESGSDALDGHWFDVYAFRLDGSEVRRVALLFTDITERKRLERSLRNRAEDLAEADRKKDEFLAMLAHELRNPLAAIGHAVTLAASGPGEHLAWSVDVIARQMKHLTHLIDDLLDVSRISRGKIDLRRGVQDLTPILDSAVGTARPLIEERKHTIEVAIARGDLWADVDPTRLEQVVMNLLNNAAKYSEDGGHIRLSASIEGDDVAISILDRGVGIPPEKLPQMFELFAQGDRSLARSEGGLGIGLTVVKKLVELHGGTIEARSDGPGLGSEFTIRLPRAARPAAPQTADNGPAAGAKTSARILVIDDSVDTARGMARLLKLLGHQVAVAHTGPEGIELARALRPEFILLDIGLPGMDGYEVAPRLRIEESCKDAVIIAVSGYGQEEDRRRSRDAGFDHHLIKPLDHDALMGLLAAGRNGH